MSTQQEALTLPVAPGAGDAATGDRCGGASVRAACRRRVLAVATIAQAVREGPIVRTGGCGFVPGAVVFVAAFSTFIIFNVFAETWRSRNRFYLDTPSLDTHGRSHVSVDCLAQYVLHVSHGSLQASDPRPQSAFGAVPRRIDTLVPRRIDPLRRRRGLCRNSTTRTRTETWFHARDPSL